MCRIRAKSPVVCTKHLVLTSRWFASCYYYYFFTRRKTLVARKLQKLQNLFGSEPYSGRLSSIKPSCSKTKLNRCTTTEIRWNKNEDARTSPPIACSGTEEQFCWLGRGTPLQSGRIHPVMRVQHTWPMTTLLDAANLAASLGLGVQVRVGSCAGRRHIPVRDLPAHHSQLLLLLLLLL